MLNCSKKKAIRNRLQANGKLKNKGINLTLNISII